MSGYYFNRENEEIIILMIIFDCYLTTSYLLITLFIDCIVHYIF